MMEVDDAQTYEEVVYILREDGTIEEKITLPDRVEQLIEENYAQAHQSSSISNTNDNGHGDNNQTDNDAISVTEIIAQQQSTAPRNVSTTGKTILTARSSNNDYNKVRLVNASGEEVEFTTSSEMEGIELDGESIEAQLLHINGLEQYGNCITSGNVNTSNSGINGSGGSVYSQVPQQLMELDDTPIDTSNINIIELDEGDQTIQLLTSPDSPNKFIIAPANNSNFFQVNNLSTGSDDMFKKPNAPVTYSYILPRTYPKKVMTTTTTVKKSRGVSPKFTLGQPNQMSKVPGVTQLLLAHEVSNLTSSTIPNCVITNARTMTKEEQEWIKNHDDAEEFTTEANPDIITYGTVEVKPSSMEEKERSTWNGIPLTEVKEEPHEEINTTETEAEKDFKTEEETPKKLKLRRKRRKAWLWSYLDQDDELLRNCKRKHNQQKDWMCALCYHLCKDQSELDNHFRTEHFGTAKFHKCRFCNKNFLTRFLCLRHEKSHRHEISGPLKLHCKPNGELLPSLVKDVIKPAPFSEAYTGHLLQLLRNMEHQFYHCLDCDIKFSDEEFVREHYDLRHAAQECIFCNQMFDNLARMEEHLNTVHDFYFLKSFPSDYFSLQEVMALEEEGTRDDAIASRVEFMHNYCQRPELEPIERRNYYNNLKNVVEEEIPEKKPKPRSGSNSKFKFIRKKAEMSTATAAQPSSTTESKDQDQENNGEENHINKEKEVNEVPASNIMKDESSNQECQICFQTFADDDEFTKHMKLKHTYEVKPKPFPCNFCEKKFATHSNRKEHERIHTNEKNYICPFCNKAFIQISNLKKHITTHKDQNLRCHTCDKQFVTKNSLVLHQRAHAADRKFKCNLCDRAYNYASLLKRHMRIHTGECPYECDICFQPFHELVSLHYHRKKVHTGERPHKCTTCGKAFILSSDLKKHLSVHNKTEGNVNSGPKAGRLKRSKKSSSSVQATNSSDIPEEVEEEDTTNPRNTVKSKEDQEEEKDTTNPDSTVKSKEDQEQEEAETNTVDKDNKEPVPS